MVNRHALKLNFWVFLNAFIIVINPLNSTNRNFNNENYFNILSIPKYQKKT